MKYLLFIFKDQAYKQCIFGGIFYKKSEIINYCDGLIQYHDFKKRKMHYKYKKHFFICNI